MKKLLLLGVLCTLSLFACKVEPDSAADDASSFAPTAFLSKDKSVEQEINPDDDRVIYNPDMGFYSAKTISISTNGALSSSSISNATLLTDDEYKSNATFNLVHLKFDISKFKNSENSLNLSNVDTLLKNMRENNQTAIIRFAYDPGYNGAKTGNNYNDYEPSDIDAILKHIEAISKLVSSNTDVITGVECGMLGPWGEMHGTTAAKKTMTGADFKSKVKELGTGASLTNIADNTTIEKAWVLLVMEKFLYGLKDVEVPFLVRQPNFIYNYLKYFKGHNFNGKTVPSHYSPSGMLYKLGLYNDGYLGSDGDLGTFEFDREQETAFIANFTNHTPYGGELCYGDTPYWRKDTINAAADEMYDVNLSFLNIGWNNHVLAWADTSDGNYTSKPDENGKIVTINSPNTVTINSKGIKSQKFFQYLLRHMGYRYEVTESTFDYYGDTCLGINVELKNNGFAELPYHRTKYIKVFFKKGSYEKEAKIATSAVPTFKGGQSSISAKVYIPNDIEAGDYDVYLKVCDNDTAGSYPIQFANGKNDWNDTLKANKIGSFTKS